MAPVFRIDRDSKTAIPVLSVDGNGVPRVVDGSAFFDLAATADITGRPVADLELLWREATSDVVGIEEGETVVDLQTGEETQLTIESLSDEEILERALRRQRGDFNLDEWSEFRTLAKAMGYDPNCGECYPKRAPNPETGRMAIVVCVKIDALEKRVLPHPAYDGMAGPWYRATEGGDWLDSWSRTTPPLEAKIVMKRKGVSEPAVVAGTWVEYATFENDDGTRTEPNRFWRIKHAFMLTKCLRARAFRELFRDVVGNVYLPEEIPDAPRRRGRERHHDDQPARSPSAEPVPSGPRLVQDEDCDLDIEPPSTQEACRAAMAKVGCGVTMVQDAMIAAGRKRHGKLEQEDPTQFWSLILTEAIKRFRRVG